MPVITTSRLKKLLCQTLIREKLSYKIIFQNTTFLFNPLKLKNNFIKKSNLRNSFPFLKSLALARKTKSHLSIKPSSRLPACKTINLLPFPEGILNQRKAVLQDNLSKHNIPFQPLETKNTTL
jgi:hypothetical protein